MKDLEWERICTKVTDAMIEYTRPFGSPLFTAFSNPRKLIGTINHIEFLDNVSGVTCKHVSKNPLFDFQLSGNSTLFCLKENFDNHPNHLDVSKVVFNQDPWNEVEHSARAIPLKLFAQKHILRTKEELLFLRGYAGENAGNGMGAVATMRFSRTD